MALLAALFAIVFASLLPAAVAASPATGAPIVLCAGGRLITAYSDADQSRHEDAGKGSLDCASALISGLAAVAAPQAPVPPAPLARPGVPAPEAVAAYVIAARPAPRPPSTAPPQA